MGESVGGNVVAKNPRVTITISQKAYEEMDLVATEKGIPLASHLGDIIEEHHNSPAYGNLVKRAKAWQQDNALQRGETREE